MLANLWEWLVTGVRIALGERVPRQWISFGGVGALGMATDALLTGILHGMMELSFALARPLPILLSMTQNYLLNNRLTFNDAQHRGTASMIRGWAAYVACQMAGAVVNWSGSVALHWTGLPWLLALFVGVALGTVINFVMAKRLVWKGR